MVVTLRTENFTDASLPCPPTPASDCVGRHDAAFLGLNWMAPPRLLGVAHTLSTVPAFASYG